MAARMVSISEAKRLAQDTGMRSIIVIQERPDGAVGYTSYGADRKLCARARRIADRHFPAVVFSFHTTGAD